MRNLKKILGILIIAAVTAAGSGAANAFWGPFDWFDDGPGWGGYPAYGYGYAPVASPAAAAPAEKADK